MRRYWVSNEALQGELIYLRGPVLHHIRDVCRQHKGAKFEVIVEGGDAYLVQIESETKQESIARVLERRSLPPLPRPHINLALSVPRFPVFEAVVEKAVELGVKRIQPLFSDQSFIRKQTSTFEHKRARFEKIVIGASQQTGRGDLMGIEPVIGLDEFLDGFNRATGYVGLFAYEASHRHTLGAKEALGLMRDQSPEEIWIFVGSEGGFSEREVQLFLASGLKPVTLGGQVLRVETACVALVSIIKYGFDLMR